MHMAPKGNKLPKWRASRQELIGSKIGNVGGIRYEQAKQYEKDYTYIPVCKEILADDITPILMLRKLAALDEQYFLLESVEGGRIRQIFVSGISPEAVRLL